MESEHARWGHHSTTSSGHSGNTGVVCSLTALNLGSFAKGFAVTSLIVMLPAIASAQDPESGKKVFEQQCSACHEIGPGAKNKVGPDLNGVVGRKAGTEAGYDYSEAMKKAGWVWDEAIFKEYITDPKKKLPGIKMLFPGIQDELNRDDLYAYISQFGPDGKIKK